jgi:hypothetical protein
MPLRKDFMATPLNDNFDQAYKKENLTPGVAGGAASEDASGRQRHADDCAAIAGVTFAEPASEKSNSNAYYSEKRCLNVQHFLQASSVIIGKRRHRL